MKFEFVVITVIGGKSKFQAQDSFSEYFLFEIWRCKKRITLSEKDNFSSNRKEQLNQTLKNHLTDLILYLRKSRHCFGKKT